MSYFYFFKSEPMCSWLLNEFINEYPKYLREPIDFDNRKVKFYVINDWVSGGGRGAKPQIYEDNNLNVVNSIEDLPEGAGIFTTGYDAHLAELEEAKKKGIPIVERPCVSMRAIREQLLTVDSNKYQLVFMIDDDHILYECYKSHFPKDIIIINEVDYKTKLANEINGKPIYLMVYPAFRLKDAQRVVQFINDNYYNEQNVLSNYINTRCLWTKQGLFEEMFEAVTTKKVNEFWVICMSHRDRSSQSVINEIKEYNIKCVVISNEQELPEKVDENARIGVLRAPIPQTNEVKNIINIIKQRFSNAIME